MLDLQEETAVSPGNRATIHSLLLTILVAMFAIDGLVPWERFCDSITHSCVQASIRGGTASLFGLLAEVLAVFLLVIAAVRWRDRSRLKRTHLVVATSVVATAGVKLGLMFLDANIFSANFNVSSPVYVGAWIGVTLLGLFFTLALAALGGESIPNRPADWVRPLVTIGATLVVVGGMAVPYSLSGFGWWGGPLSPPHSFGAHGGIGLVLRPGQTAPVQGTIYVENGGWATATLDDVRLTKADPGVRLVGAFVLASWEAPCPSGSHWLATLPACGFPLAGYRVTQHGEKTEAAILPIVVGASQGKYLVREFRLDYHVGFVHFQLPEPAEVHICVKGSFLHCRAPF